jgi:hypothetical protein
VTALPPRGDAGRLERRHEPFRELEQGDVGVVDIAEERRRRRGDRAWLSDEEAEHVDEVRVVEHRSGPARRALLVAGVLVVLEVERPVVPELSEPSLVQQLLRERDRRDVAVVEPDRVRHTAAAAAASRIVSACAASTPSGFSQSTGLPRSSAAIDGSA